MGPLWECLGVLVCVPQSPSPKTHLMGLQSWMSQSMHFNQHFMVALLVKVAVLLSQYRQQVTLAFLEPG